MELFQKKEPTTREGGPNALELIRYIIPESSALELFLLLTIVIALLSLDDKFQLWDEDSRLVDYWHAFSFIVFISHQEMFVGIC